MLTFYRFLIRLLVPLMILRLWWRSIAYRAYRAAWWQRLAVAQDKPLHNSPRLWIHAVSVGETLAIAPLIEALLAANQYSILLTSTTPTGREQVKRLFGARVDSAWIPFDTPGAVNRFLDHWRPLAALFVETEIWPNAVLLARERHLPTLLLNARLSQQSARGYARFGRLSRVVLAAFDVIACQTRAHARRFAVLGGREDALQVVGSIKFDIDPAALRLKRDHLAAEWGLPNGRFILAAASTHPGEESMVMTAFARLRHQNPQSLLLLAPRHPERADSIVDEAVAAGWRIARRSQGGEVSADIDIWLLDTLGELAAAVGLADLVFVGGSLVAHGGHNPIEAAAFGKAVLSGPHTHNFFDIYKALRVVRAVVTVADRAELETVVVELAAAATRRHQMGQAGLAYCQRQQGALQVQHALIEAHCGDKLKSVMTP